MARAGDEFLDQDVVVAKAFGRFALAAFQRCQKVLAVIDLAHPLAAAAGDRLDQHRIADLVCFRFQMLGVLVLAVIAGRNRHTGLLHQRLGAVLETHCPDRVRRRPDEHDPRLGAGLGETGILRQEAIAGMDRFRAGLPGDFEYLFGLQIAFRRRRRPDEDRFVSHLHMGRLRVGLGIDRDGTNPHLLGGAHHAAGNLAAVRNQDRLEHGRQLSSGFSRPFALWTPATRTKEMIIRRYHEPSLCKDTGRQSVMLCPA